MRALVGMGLTYGNSKTSMPYDYSFYAGGANDVRGWRASALGPGSYKYYIDTNGTSIQVGDIRLAGSAEYRFQFNKKLKGAFFIDAGNIWTIRTDNNRLGSKFSGNWFKEIAVAPGIGFGHYGDNHVRFALIENEARTRQAVRGIKEMFRKDGLI